MDLVQVDNQVEVGVLLPKSHPCRAVVVVPRSIPEEEVVVLSSLH